MTDEIEPLPEYITSIIREAGDRVVVLVEGPDDQLALREWFRDRRTDAEFFGVSGKQDVLSKLPEIIAKRPDVVAYGIVDRDFAEDSEVQATLDDPGAACFLLRRFSIENYALEPQAVFDILRVFLRERLPLEDAAAVQAYLLDVCSQLRTMMAANYVIRQTSHELPLFHERYQLLDRPSLIALTAQTVGITEMEAEARVVVREAVIDTELAALSTAYRYVNGKHLLRQIQTFANRERPPRWAQIEEGYLFSQLVEWNKNNRAPHSDLVEIIDQRILGHP